MLKQTHRIAPTRPFARDSRMSDRPVLLVSVSGVRGLIGNGLSADVAARFAAAYGSTIAGKSVVLARDSRPSGSMLRHAVIAGLLGAGCTVDDIGIAPTPTCGFAVRQLNAAGGIQITASHNPAPWNGLKMFGPDGRGALGRRTGRSSADCSSPATSPVPKWDGIGTTQCRRTSWPSTPGRCSTPSASRTSRARVPRLPRRQRRGRRAARLAAAARSRLRGGSVRVRTDRHVRPRARADPRPPRRRRAVGEAVANRRSGSSSTRTPTGSRSSTRPAPA